MTREELRIGTTVWAQAGSTGWRPAVVVKIGRDRQEATRVYLYCETGTTHNAVRTPDLLRPRDPALRGKDKPRPPWKEAKILSGSES